MEPFTRTRGNYSEVASQSTYDERDKHAEELGKKKEHFTLPHRDQHLDEAGHRHYDERHRERRERSHHDRHDRHRSERSDRHERQHSRRSRHRHRHSERHDRSFDECGQREHLHSDRSRHHRRRHEYRHDRLDHKIEPKYSSLNSMSVNTEEEAEATTPTPLKRDDWMLDTNHSDVFASMGTAKLKPTEEKHNPDVLQVTSRELNPMLKPRKDASLSSAPTPPSFGGPGFKWRMMKLDRTYELAEERDLTVEQVALERYGSMELFDEARSERRFLEDRGDLSRRHDTSREPTVRTGFRRPGGSAFSLRDMSATWQDASDSPKTRPASKSRIPSVLSAPASAPAVDSAGLNRLEARVLSAELSNKPEAATLREELEKTRAQAKNSPTMTVETVPVLDGFGRLYDVGSNDAESSSEVNVKQRSRKRAKLESDAEEVTLEDLAREERFGAGREDQKNADAIFAQGIATDHSFIDDTDYMDDEAQRLARRKMRDNAMKRQFAIQGRSYYYLANDRLRTYQACTGRMSFLLARRWRHGSAGQHSLHGDVRVSCFA